MSTDDRDDVESENPAKSFKVGEVDRLSGFFTPVWESKRRLRADSPVPPSSAAASAPSSSRSALSEKTPPPPPAVTRPSVPPPAPAEPPPKAALAPARTSSPPPPPRASKPAPAQPPRATKPLGSRGAAEKRVEPKAPEKSATELAPTPLVPPAAEAAPAAAAPQPAALASASAAMKVGGATLRGVATPLPPLAPSTTGDDSAPPAPPAAAAPEPASPEAPAAGQDRVAAAFAAAAAVTVRPVIPMPLTPPVRPASRAKSTPVPAPSAAALALKNAGPNLPAEAFLDREPEFRQSSPGTSPPPARAEVDPRAVRAVKAATSLHAQLERKLITDSVDTFARHRETESEREALQAAAERAAKQPPDPYPSHVLRTLRRTIHLSSALPEAVRQMLEKYRY